MSVAAVRAVQRPVPDEEERLLALAAAAAHRQSVNFVGHGGKRRLEAAETFFGFEDPLR